MLKIILIALALVLVACKPTKPSVKTTETRNVEEKVLIDSFDYSLTKVCDEGNLIYMYHRYKGGGIAVVPKGCESN